MSAATGDGKSRWPEALMPKEQPAPTPNNRPAVWSLVIREMADRDALGVALTAAYREVCGRLEGWGDGSS